MPQQPLLLEEVTFNGVKEVRNTRGEVIVGWQETTAIDGAPSAFLSIEVKSEPGSAGIVNCNRRNDVEYLALHSDGLNAAVIEQGKRWLDTCFNNNIGQCDNLKWSRENPPLLVEILSPTSIRLCENQASEYVALSYCWGDIQSLSQAERNEIM